MAVDQLEGDVPPCQPRARAEQLRVCPTHVLYADESSLTWALFCSSFPTAEVKLENLADLWLLSTELKRHNPLCDIAANRTQTLL